MGMLLLCSMQSWIDVPLIDVFDCLFKGMPQPRLPHRLYKCSGGLQPYTLPAVQLPLGTKRAIFLSGMSGGTCPHPTSSHERGDPNVIFITQPFASNADFKEPLGYASCLDLQLLKWPPSAYSKSAVRLVPRSL